MREGTKERRRSLYEEAVEIIEREYASDMDLDSVAHRLATSRRQLQRAFAEIGKTSFRTQSSMGLKVTESGGQNALRTFARISSGESCTKTAVAPADLLIFIEAQKSV